MHWFYSLILENILENTAHFMLLNLRQAKCHVNDFYKSKILSTPNVTIELHKNSTQIMYVHKVSWFSG